MSLDGGRLLESNVAMVLTRASSTVSNVYSFLALALLYSLLNLTYNILTQRVSLMCLILVRRVIIAVPDAFLVP